MKRGSVRWLFWVLGAVAALLVVRWIRAGVAPQPAAARGSRDARGAEPAEARAPDERAARLPRASDNAADGEIAVPPTIAVPASDASRPNARVAVLLHASWGSQPGELGHSRPREANPEAPMSLAVDPRGQLVVLDQVNNRVARFDRDGHPAGTVPLPVRAAQDLAFGRDGTMAVLDRLGDRAVALVGPDGRARGTLPLVGPGLDEGGAATGVFVDGNDVYVEREHGPLVRIGRTDGTAADTDAARAEIPGRPTRDGRTLIAAMLVDAATGRLAINAIDRATGAHRFTRVYDLGATLRGILLLDSDRAGTIYTAALVQPLGEPGDGAHLSVRLMCVEPTAGRPLGGTTLPANTSPDETFREFTVLDEGGVLYVLRDESGATVQRVECP